MKLHWSDALPLCLMLLSQALLAQADTAAVSAVNPPGSPATAETVKHPLRQILVGESVEDVTRLLVPPSGGAFVTLTPALARLDAKELGQRLAQAKNQFIEEPLLVAIAQAIEIFAHRQNFPHATAIIPPQNIGAGIVRVALLLDPPVIHRILIGDGVEDAQKFQPPADGQFVVLSPTLAVKHREELEKRLAQSENQVFSERIVAAIAKVIEIYFRQQDFPLASAVVPPQSSSDGTLRVAVQRGRIRNIKMAGNRWFSDSLLREKLRIDQGELLRASELERALSWTNNNPFRHVRVQIDPVAGTGEADLTIAVQEKFPLRGQVIYDNGGNAIVGENRFTAGATYANLWGLDHQISYQFVTTDLGPRTYQGHGFDYRIPLPWRDQLQFSASYLLARPTFYDGLFTQNGENLTSSIRYTHPLRDGEQPMEVYAGLDFRESNNNLAFGGAEILATKTDIFQFTFGGTMIRRDTRGAWAFGVNLSVSPGRINSRNADAAFHDTRALANPRYVYGQLSFQRLLNLPHGWDLTSRGILQLASSNLLSSEQLYIGGSSTVRGFRENVFGGDQGFLLTNDLLAPGWKGRLPFLSERRSIVETRLLGFFDVANVRPHEITNVDTRTVPLASAGVGVRVNLAPNLFLSADYGWQLTYLPYDDKPSRGHVRATLAF